MFFKTAAASLLAATAAVQAADLSTVTNEIAEALLSFQAQGLIPQPVPQNAYNLSSGVALSFSNNDDQKTTLGQRFTLPSDQNTLSNWPAFVLDVADDQEDMYAQQNFTAMIVDPGAAGQTLGGSNVTRHYLANNLKYSSDDSQLTNSSALTITSYNAPGPAAGSGPHRYLALVFQQGNSFTPPAGLNTAGTPLSTMILSDYITNSKIGKIVAMSYIIVENTSQGEMTFSSTSAVPSASVAAAASSASASLAGSATRSAATSSGSSGSSSGSSSGASALGFSGALAVAGAAVVGAALL